MKNRIPPRQQAVLDVVRRSLAHRGQAPTILEIAGELGISGPTVHQHLGALERRGLLWRKRGSPRGIQLVDPVPAVPGHDCVRVPIVVGSKSHLLLVGPAFIEFTGGRPVSLHRGRGLVELPVQGAGRPPLRRVHMGRQ